jgi:2-oxoisovalerate dehydrogenase E1 component alpha subunit
VSAVDEHRSMRVLTEDRVLFPGALNSEFTDKLDFIQPSQHNAIPTYRVMNQYGEIIDKEIGVETEDDEALQIYKNMVKCQSSWILSSLASN